jgi:ribosomal protein S18 acetylase RimI-like enzyme
MELRPIQAKDRAPLAALLEKVENFAPGEVGVALELIDGAIRGPESEYFALVADDDARVAGYICYGPTPMTEAAWDLYWVAVDSQRKGQGIGKKLLRAFEAVVREKAGRIIRIETSSMESYGGTLEFYLREGYAIVSRVEDFYKTGDDLITLIKKL